MRSPVLVRNSEHADAIRIVLIGALAAYFPSNEKSAAQFSLKCFFSGLQGMVQWGKCSEFPGPKCYTYCREAAAQLILKKDHLKLDCLLCPQITN